MSRTGFDHATYSGDVVTVPLDVEAVTRFAAVRGIGADVVVLAAHVAVLSRYSVRADVAITLRDTECVIVIDLADGPDFDGLVDRVRSTVAGSRVAVVGHPDVDLLLTGPDRAGVRGRIAHRHAGHLARAVLAAVSDSKARVADLPLLTDAEHDQVTRVFAHGPQPTWSDATIHALVGEQALLRPDAIALECGDERITYADLDTRSRRMAMRLVDHGVRHGDLVGLCLPRSPDMVVAMLGIVRAGGAYVPLDPTHPPGRVADLLADARPAIVVTSAETQKVLPGTGFDLLHVESSEACPEVPLPEVSPRDLAYVIFTSGSTGKPKGVLVEHRGVANLMRAVRAPYDFGPHTRILQFAAVTFDASVLEIFPPLSVGGTVVFAAAGDAAAGLELLDFLRAKRINSVHLPPSLLAELPEHDLPGLTHLYTGAETCGADVAVRWSRGRRFVHCYGPTETSVLATLTTTVRENTTPPIGTPLPGVEVLVLDRNRQPVPVGVIGEIHIGGAGVARGYLHNETLTAERFQPHPLTGNASEPMYRTGDLGRWSPDGELEFVGRADGQVKIRGHRVEPGEVEAVLAAMPGVRSCAVVSKEDGSTARLVGFVVLDGNTTVERVRADIERRLPAYLVPSDIIALATLPTTVHHKVDRAALRSWTSTGRPAHLPYSPASPGAEATLAEIWAEVLGVTPVGRHDSFIDLGGTSLQAVRVAARLAQRSGARVPVAALLGGAALTDVVAAITEQPATPVAASPAAEMTVSPGQRRIWFVSQFEPMASVAYNEPAAVWVMGSLDTTALTHALNDVVARHPSLRTTFVLRSGELQASIADQITIPVPVVDVPDREAAMREARLVAGTAFDLATGPLLRASVFRVGAHEHLVTLVFHHLVCDGLSVDIVDQDLAEAYAARLQGKQTHGHVEPGMNAYLAWHATRSKSEVDNETAEWLATLAGAPTVVDLPTARPRPPRITYRGGKRSRPLPPHVWHAAEELAKANRVTPYVVHLAAFGLTLSGLTGSGDLVIGSSAAGRPTPDTERTVGFFANTMVLRLDVNPARSVPDYIAGTARMAADALDHQYVPFERLVAGLVTGRDASRPPLVQAFFAFHGRQRARAAFTGTSVTPVLIDRGAAKLEFVVEVEENAAGAAVSAEFASDLFDTPTIDGWLDQYADRLARLTENPAGHVADLIRD
ncbi:amino acid adenylation domain-containing protein [Kibdelosporangium aridum]|uniref:amino acid adenylation domain-containing protein n=1 Tax=Kibdelosporangium aridum TaxID=2030 RepID=UPI0035EBF954